MHQEDDVASVSVHDERAVDVQPRLGFEVAHSVRKAVRPLIDARPSVGNETFERRS